jgi:hypothetical protein
LKLISRNHLFLPEQKGLRQMVEKTSMLVGDKRKNVPDHSSNAPNERAKLRDHDLMVRKQALLAAPLFT